ncbi:MAG: histone H1 [Bacteroidota bacterium]
MEQFEKVKDLVMGLESDFAKFYNENNGAAGTRIRKGMQSLKTVAQEIRLEVQEIKNKRKEEK